MYKDPKKRNEYMRKWRQAHKEHCRLTRRAWLKKNPNYNYEYHKRRKLRYKAYYKNYYSAYYKKYRKKHPEKYARYFKKWYQKNKVHHNKLRTERYYANLETNRAKRRAQYRRRKDGEK